MLTPVKPLPVHRDHSRAFDDFRFVYPVVSRRSGGLSIGLNVNPDKRCNFDCLYCQVDRTVPVLHSNGIRPMNVVITVIIFGRIRFTAP